MERILSIRRAVKTFEKASLGRRPTRTTQVKRTKALQYLLTAGRLKVFVGMNRHL
jgi:hypothetical protein